MLLALVLCFDNRKTRDTGSLTESSTVKGHKYMWYALSGYAIGLISALAAGILTRSPQPALLYLVRFIACLITSLSDTLLHVTEKQGRCS